MRCWSVLLAAVASLGVAAAGDTVLHNEYGSRQVCAGVYSKKDWHGKNDPRISVAFPRSSDLTGSVAVVVYAYADIGALGVEVTRPDGEQATQFICDQATLDANLCSHDEYGTIIINKYAEHRRQIVTKHVEFPYDDVITYDVDDTDYYCVAVAPIDGLKDFHVSVTYLNPYGYLDASDAPLIAYHFAQAGAYGLVLILWLWRYIKYRREILKVQNYITALGVIMVCEQVFVAGYYLAVNRRTHPRPMMFLVALYSAARLSYTFFLLTIVSLGYSVVYPSLGPKLRWALLLGGLVFTADFLFSLDAYYFSSEGTSQSLFGAVIFLPLTALLAINYAWMLQSLGQTAQYLLNRKQHVKYLMYRRLYWILGGSAFAVLAFVALHGMVAITESVRDFVTTYWKYKWVLADGWPNIVYFVAFCIIGYLWRPTGKNQQFAMSTQLAQSEADAEEFEIGSLNGSDEEDEFGVEGAAPEGPPPSYTTPSSGGANEPPVFDADADHGLSDLDDDEGLHRAPGGRLRS